MKADVRLRLFIIVFGSLIAGCGDGSPEPPVETSYPAETAEAMVPMTSDESSRCAGIADRPPAAAQGNASPGESPPPGDPPGDPGDEQSCADGAEWRDGECLPLEAPDDAGGAPEAA